MAKKIIITKSEKWKKRGIRAGIIVLSFIALLLLFDKIIMPWYVKRGEVTVLPKVVGIQVDEAIRILENAGYEPIKYETQYDEKAKEGTIIRQTPEGGDETKPGRKVYLIISSGKEMVTIPNLIGMQLKDARIVLVRANLDLGKQSTEFNDSVASGIVIHQSPQPNAKISALQKIDIVVSEGSRAGKVPVPDMIGASLQEALLRLGNAKLGVGKTTFEPGEGKPNTVYEQSPRGGELVLVGSTVDLFIVKEKITNTEEH
jgi:beta-lactam-binding protein with PASTA domain